MDSESVIRLRRVIGKLARLLNATSATEDLTPTQSSVLGLVVFRGPLGVAELAELEGLNPTMCSRVVSKLDSDGLLRRLPDPADMRIVQLEATDAGREVATRITERRTQTVAAALRDLPADVTDSLTAALPALEALAEGLRTGVQHPSSR